KQSDHGRFLRVSLYAVVVRGAGDAVHEAPRGYRNGIVRIERRAAIPPPCARQTQREPVGGIRMRSTHIAGIPSHQHEIGARGVKAAIERPPLPAMWRATAPIAPFDLIRQGNRRLGWIDSASSRLRAPQSERQGGEERASQEFSTTG